MEKFFFYYNRKDKRDELPISGLLQQMLEVVNKVLYLENKNVIASRLK